MTRVGSARVEDYALFERSKRAGAESRWIPLLAGFVTATSAPKRARLEDWAARGVTDVVTLQREHELAAWLRETCRETGLRWHHLPLSGKRLAEPGDRRALAQLPRLLELLRAPAREPAARRVVLHCSAGLHRTGVCLYLLLRLAGMSQESAVAKIELARPLTARELQKRTRKTGVLLERAEALLHGPGALEPVAD